MQPVSPTSRGRKAPRFASRGLFDSNFPNPDLTNLTKIRESGFFDSCSRFDELNFTKLKRLDESIPRITSVFPKVENESSNEPQKETFSSLLSKKTSLLPPESKEKREESSFLSSVDFIPPKHRGMVESRFLPSARERESRQVPRLWSRASSRCGNL